MIKILKGIYTVYTGIIFFLLLLITMPFFFLFNWLLGKRSLGILMMLCRFIGWGLGLLCGIFYIRHRNPKIDRSKTYVIIANHRSNMDAPVAAIACWGRVRYLAKQELLKIPVLGLVFRTTTVNVDRSSKESRKISMERLMDYLRNGDHIFIFPEGTRNKTKDQEMIGFKDGAFSIAIQTQTAILPMIYLNSNKIMPADSLLMRPGKIDIYYLDPIDVSGYGENDVQRLKADVRKIMVAKYIELNSSVNKSSPK